MDTPVAGWLDREAIQELILFLSAFQVIPSCTTRLSGLQTGLLLSFQFSLAELLIYDGMASSLSSISKSLVGYIPIFETRLSFKPQSYLTSTAPKSGLFLNGKIPRTKKNFLGQFLSKLMQGSQL